MVGVSILLEILTRRCVQWGANVGIRAWLDACRNSSAATWLGLSKNPLHAYFACDQSSMRHY